MNTDMDKKTNGLLHGLARPPAPERGIRRVLDRSRVLELVGIVSDTTEWLAPRWGNVYLHETVIAHIRRLLDTDYRCASLNETAPRFQGRMNRVAAHLHSPNFRAHGGRGMCGLAKDLRRHLRFASMSGNVKRRVPCYLAHCTVSVIIMVPPVCTR